ncbi:MAG: glycosyltransferase family 2 protein [Candidatus Omnitrophica bacterium]|nr:glycosyltransferase family 2 protein [Candidatus Omnitrophota bacterium]
MVLDHRVKRQEPVEAQRLPTVSVIIAAYNEEAVIEQRMENCLVSTYPPELLEVIIASDGSTDKTNEIVRRYEERGIKLYAFKQRRGKVNVLNEVVAKARGEILVFSDANAMFARDAITKIVRHFQDSMVGCVCGSLHFIKADESETIELEGFYWKFETFLKRVEGKLGACLGANGAIFAVRKNLFYCCPPDTIVEDFVISMKVLEKGFKALYDPQAVAFEHTAKKIIQEKQRRVRIGAGDYQALTMLWPMLDPRKGFGSVAFWSHKVLRWCVPFFLFIALAANIVLALHFPYGVLLAMQLVFYGCALIGQILSRREKKVKIFNLCYYFVSMNLALFLGFLRFVSGTQKVTWDRTQRVECAPQEF